MAQPLTTSEVLNRAADLIEERGWGQGPDAMTLTGAALCVMGAIAAASDMHPNHRGEASYGDVERCPAGVAVADYLGRPELWCWNDDQADSSTVIEVLRATAVIEAARERETAEATR